MGDWLDNGSWEPDWSAAPAVEVRRLAIIAVGVSILFASGVYWLRSAATGATPRTSSSLVQVHVMPTLEPPALTPNLAAAGNTVLAPNAQRSPTEAKPAPAVSDAHPYARQLALANAEPPPLSALTGAENSDLSFDFQNVLFARIAEFKRYPDAARFQHLQGVAHVTFTMQRDGTVLNVWIDQSSGSSILDQEAVNTIWRAQPLPPIPASLPGQMSIKTPVAFE